MPSAAVVLDVKHKLNAWFALHRHTRRGTGRTARPASSLTRSPTHETTRNT
jgi:hypothetical protein